MARVNPEREPDASSPKRGRPASPPSARNCAIYERVRLDGESQEKVAAEHAVSRQRIAEIVAQVENWIASHSTHELAQKMRVRCGRRWEMLWSEAMTSFTRSREDREIKKERTRRAEAGEFVATDTELTTRQQNGDPRFLHIACRVAEREDRLWLQDEADRGHADAAPPADGHETGAGRANATQRVAYRYEVAQRFPYLPAGLCDLEHLACGLRSGPESGCRNGTESVPYRNGGTAPAQRGYPGRYRYTDALTPISILFEQRCAEAFRALGFDVRELGQGCGRVADCLAVAAVERFAVIIDAKVRRRGYTLGTDDRQFCEYATRHARELALSGIERIYFAVVGHGFRQDDLDKLAGFMVGTPIRSVVFLEAEALLRLVNDSIARRREFRLLDVDQLLFGNKIVE